MLRLILLSLSSLLFANSVYANDAFIYYNSNNTGAEYSRLKSHLETLGFTVTGSTNTTVSSSAVAGKELVIDIAGTSNCGSTCRSVYDSYVSGGGKLIISAPSGATNRQGNIESLIENKMSVGTMTYYGSCSSDICYQSYKKSDYSTTGVTDYLPGTARVFSATGGTAMAINGPGGSNNTWYKWDYGSNGGSIIVTTGYDQFQTNLTYTSSMTAFLTATMEEEGLYTSSSSGSSSPTPVYSSGITGAQSTKRTSKLADTAAHGMEAHVAIDGNSNDVTVEQIGDAHYLELSIVGDSNVVAIEQTSTVGGTHYLETTVNGSNNVLDVLQQDTSKTAIIDIDGDYNTGMVVQKGTGQHYLQLDMIGDGHDATIVQDGAGSHEATVELINGGGAWDFDLNQTGSTSKEYSLPHGMSDGTTTSGTCYVAAGCSLSITQTD